MTATGVLVVGGLFSCTQSDETQVNSKTQPKKLLAIPTKMITVRIRVGKIRNKDGFVLDGNHICLTKEGWKLPSTNTLSPETIDQVMWIRAKDTHTMIMLEKIKRCSGIISMHPRPKISPHSFDIVVHLPMEEYLPGVIAGELYSHWHPDTFAAQAVAARSYAAAQHLQRKETSHYDVSDGPSSQVFLGDVALDVAHRAVKDTHGVLLTWKDTVVPSYYSACCGGMAAVASDAISSSHLHDIPPLGGRGGTDACTSLGVHQWTATRSHRNLKKRLEQWSGSFTNHPLGQLGSIQSIIPVQTNKHGRPVGLEIIDHKKNHHKITAKQFVHVANTPFPAIPKPTPKVWSSCLVASRSGSDIELRGVGMGHGVGLCQYGAQVLAGKNTSWESILEWYYPRVTLASVL
jgi:SpoIID/LytB domain protein